MKQKFKYELKVQTDDGTTVTFQGNDREEFLKFAATMLEGLKK